MPHQYLVFSASATYGGYAVGDGSSNKGNGLSNKDIIIVQIPKVFETKKIFEIKQSAFRSTGITSIFIPKTIKYIGKSAFGECSKLNDVRFEADSELEKLDELVFSSCKALQKIDFPASLKEIASSYNDYIFWGVNSLECFSYLGTSDFSELYIFDHYPQIHVSPSYKYYGIGQKGSNFKDGSTCGVSNEPFYKENEDINVTYHAHIRRIQGKIIVFL